MEASSFNLQSGRKLLSTRRGTMILAAVCALLAGLILLLFMNRYQDSVKGDVAPTPVLVAKSLIPKGTSGTVIAEQQLLETTRIPREDVRPGAINDPGLIAGQVTTADIYPGQQATAGLFTASTGTVLPQLAGDQRAIAIPVEGARGLVGQVQDGDRVDLLVGVAAQSGARGRALIRTLMQNVLVLRAPGGGGEDGEEASDLIVRVSDRDAPKLAYAADNGTLWVLLRPGGGAKQSRPSTVTLESLLAGTQPVEGAE